MPFQFVTAFGWEGGGAKDGLGVAVGVLDRSRLQRRALTERIHKAVQTSQEVQSRRDGLEKRREEARQQLAALRKQLPSGSLSSRDAQKTGGRVSARGGARSERGSKTERVPGYAAGSKGTTPLSAAGNSRRKKRSDMDAASTVADRGQRLEKGGRGAGRNGVGRQTMREYGAKERAAACIIQAIVRCRVARDEWARPSFGPLGVESLGRTRGSRGGGDALSAAGGDALSAGGGDALSAAGGVAKHGDDSPEVDTESAPPRAYPKAGLPGVRARGEPDAESSTVVDDPRGELDAESASVVLQKVYRGHAARLMCAIERNLQAEEAREREEEKRQAAAVIVQKRMRGHIVRVRRGRGDLLKVRDTGGMEEKRGGGGGGGEMSSPTRMVVNVADSVQMPDIAPEGGMEEKVDRSGQVDSKEEHRVQKQEGGMERIEAAKEMCTEVPRSTHAPPPDGDDGLAHPSVEYVKEAQEARHAEETRKSESFLEGKHGSRVSSGPITVRGVEQGKAAPSKEASARASLIPPPPLSAEAQQRKQAASKEAFPSMPAVSRSRERDAAAKRSEDVMVVEHGTRAKKAEGGGGAGGADVGKSKPGKAVSKKAKSAGKPGNGGGTTSMLFIADDQDDYSQHAMWALAQITGGGTPDSLSFTAPADLGHNKAENLVKGSGIRPPLVRSGSLSALNFTAGTRLATVVEEQQSRASTAGRGHGLWTSPEGADETETFRRHVTGTKAS